MNSEQDCDGGLNYVIVGAGAVGCVLANRLSEDPDNQVLLLEYGDGTRTGLPERGSVSLR